MTNFERIKEMSVEELAEFLLYTDTEGYHQTHSIEWFNPSQKDRAIAEEKRWLEEKIS